MASVLQTIKAITSEGYLSNYLRDWLNGIERSIPKGSDTQTVRFNGDVLEATSDFVILASGDVGIGAAGTNGRKLRVLGDTNANAYVTIVNSLANGTATLGFGDPEDDNIGYLQYNNSTENLTIGTNGATKQVINSAGRSAFQNGTGNVLYVEAGRGGGTSDAIWSNATATPLQIGLFNAGNTANLDFYCQGSGAMRFILGSNDRMRIDSNGYALIGYTSSNGAFRLQVNSQIFATNSTIATSDARFKTNVLDIPTGMDVVSALRPVSFDWKQGEGHSFVEHRDLGFIAQEAETALSGKEYIKGVVKDVGSFKGMAYDKLIPILVKALQEQKAEIDSLTTRIEALEV